MMDDRLQNMARYGLMMVCFLCLLLGGCGVKSTEKGGAVSIVTPDFFGIGEDVALQLSRNIRRPVGSNGRLIMTSMVNIDDLYQTSRFGRTLTESLSTRLFSHGFGVIDVRKASDLFIQNDRGEFVLTRDAGLLAREHDVEGIVAGTYSLTPNSVIINVRMLDAGSQEVISVAGIEVQRSNNINDLLAVSAGISDAQLSAYER